MRGHNQWQPPTKLLTTSEVASVRIGSPPSVRWRPVTIVWAFARLATHLLALKLTWRLSPELFAQHVSATLEHLGFAWVKLGQVLSLRVDLLPAPLCSELRRLQHSAEGYSPALARQVVEQELGASVEELFDQYDELPVAAASICQVHCATLADPDQTKVAIKVMRPGADAVFAGDLRFIRACYRALGLLPILRDFELQDLVWELEQIVEEEVDYRRELANLERFGRSVRDHGIVVPRGYAEYSSQRVLAMEWIDGVLMSDVISVRQSDPDRCEAWLDENDVDPTAVAETLLFSFLRQLLDDNLFHGDLHPGNILLLRSSRVALIDLGTLGTAPADLRRRYEFSIRALAQAEYDKAADLLISFCEDVPSTGLPTVRKRMIQIMRAWEAKSHARDLPYYQKSMSSVLMEVVQVMAVHRLLATWAFLKIDRSLLTLDAALADLMPEANYTDLFRDFFVEREERMFRELLGLNTFKALVLGVPRQIEEYRLFADPIIRRSALVVTPQLSVLAAVFELVFKLLQLAAVGVIVIISSILLERHSRFLESAESRLLRTYREWLRDLPVPEPDVLVLALFGTAYLYLLIRQTRVRLRLAGPK